MNRRKALKSVLALTAAAPVAGLAKAQEPHTLTIGIDSPAITEAMNDIAALQPKTGTFEWALRKMREGHIVCCLRSMYQYNLSEDSKFFEIFDEEEDRVREKVTWIRTEDVLSDEWEVMTYEHEVAT